MVNTLLTELDGLDARKSVYVIAATNRPDMIDPAMVRPGRLDKLLYVDLPSADERAEIIRTVTRKVPLSYGVIDQVDVSVRHGCEGYSGADLAALVREAGVVALKRTLGALDEMDDTGTTPKVEVFAEDFQKAMQKVGPSVSEAQKRKYEALKSKFSGMPVRTRREQDEEKLM